METQVSNKWVFSEILVLCEMAYLCFIFEKIKLNNGVLGYSGHIELKNQFALVGQKTKFQSGFQLGFSNMKFHYNFTH